MSATKPSAATTGRHSGASKRLARSLGLRLVATGELTITRQRHGRAFSYVDGDGRPLRDAAVVRWLDSLAVPPAYVRARYCPDPHGHLQAIWRDAAGRLQYRYHPAWEQVRNGRRVRRLARLAKALPRIRRAVTSALTQDRPNRELALGAVIDLVTNSGIRAGGEAYAREHGTRGAATLLKSDVKIVADRIELAFRGKGGKSHRQELRSRRLARAIKRMQRLPGRRVFQYRNGDGSVKRLRARDVNAYLRELTGTPISLKDFRTLTASAATLAALGRLEPARSAARRKKQVRAAMQVVADQLGNTPAICRKSYVPARLIAAFETRRLRRMVRGRGRSERLLAALLAAPRPTRRAAPDLKTQLERSVQRLGDRPKSAR